MALHLHWEKIGKKNPSVFGQNNYLVNVHIYLQDIY